MKAFLMALVVRRAWLAALCALSAVVWVSTSMASISPVTNTLTIAAGGSGTEAKVVGVPSTPPNAEIELAIDTTGSMSPSIAQAQSDALSLVSGVQGMIPTAQFAVVQFKDAGDSPEYNVEQSLTSNPALIQTAVNGLSAAGGGDAPEAYNLVFHNSYTPAVGGPIGWSTGARKFVVVLGDAEPHGAGAAGFAGCSDASADPDGLNTATELAGMASNQRTLFMIRQASSASTSLACYQSLAAAAFAGGQGVDGGTSLSAQIISLINAATGTVNNVQLQVTSASAGASASWVSFSPSSAGPVNPPVNLNFTVTVNVPAATPAGTYTFDITAFADGANIGTQMLTVIVPASGGHHHQPPHQPPHQTPSPHDDHTPPPCHVSCPPDPHDSGDPHHAPDVTSPTEG